MTNRFTWSDQDFDTLVFTNKINKYSPDQNRDDHGRFSFVDGESSSDPAYVATQTALLRDNQKISLPKDEAVKLINAMATNEMNKGETDGPINIALIDIQGTNVFNGSNLGYSRSQMPQVPTAMQGEFENYLTQHDILFTHEISDRPDEFKPIQKEISVVGTYANSKYYLDKLDRPPVIVSADGYVMDGHHRWAGAVLAEFQDSSTQMNVSRVNLNHDELLQIMYNFNHDNAIGRMDLGQVRKYSPDQARNEHGRFATEGTTVVSGDASNLRVSIQEFDPENAPLALPSWANQNTRVDWREPHIGLSDKAKEVASRISASTNVDIYKDERESSKNSTAIYTAPNGKEWSMKYSGWETFGEHGGIVGKVEVYDNKNLIGQMSFGKTEYVSSFASIQKIEVFPDYQRQGIATAMLEFARRETPSVGIVHSRDLSTQGKLFSDVTKYASNALYSNFDGSCIVFDFLDGNNIYARIVSSDGTESEPQELDNILADGKWQPIYPEDAVVKSLLQDLQKFSVDQPRDFHGRFSFADDTEGGGGNSEPKSLVTINDKDVSKKLTDGSIEKLVVTRIAGDAVPIKDIYKPETPYTITDMGRIAVTELLMKREPIDADALEYADTQLKDMLDNSTPSVQLTVDGLDSILDSDRFLTLEELGSTVSAFGTEDSYNGEDWYRGVRLMAEYLWFNYDNNTNAGERPIYGYMRPNDSTKYVDDGMKAYGEIRVELKPDVLDRTTISIGDSLNNTDTATPFQYGASMASTGFTQHFAIIANNYFDDGKDGNYFASEEFRGRFAYVEAQFHGGIDTADIAKVYLPYKDEDLQARLDDAGIPWKVGRK